MKKMITIKDGLNHITAQFCAACRIKCRKVQIYSLKRFAVGKSEYWPVVVACRDAGVSCEAMADLCFHLNPVVAQLLRDCARKCDRCADDCENVFDPRLADLGHAARETARACRALAWDFWKNYRRKLGAQPITKVPAAVRGPGGQRKLARPIRRPDSKRPPAAHRDAG